ncbi:MAG: hypothetical protein OEV53_12455 [Nitrospira sp.]|nr:hypothetical protein [Nitrospira sp.]
MPTRGVKTKNTRGRKIFPKAKHAKKARRPQGRTLARGAEPATSIGPELMEVINHLVSLMRETTDPRELEQLDRQRIALSEEAARCIDSVLDETTAHYQAAIEGLQETSETIRKAIQGIETVRAVILKAAKAAELVGKVAAMV